MGLGGQVVYFIRSHAAHQLEQVAGIGQISVVECKAFGQVGTCQKVVNSAGIGGRTAADYAVHGVTFIQQQFREVGAVLACDACNQSRFHK